MKARHLFQLNSKSVIPSQLRAILLLLFIHYHCCLLDLHLFPTSTSTSAYSLLFTDTLNQSSTMLSNRPTTTGPRRAFSNLNSNTNNENIISSLNNNKTPGGKNAKTPAGKTPGKRRALGDISNRKAPLGGGGAKGLGGAKQQLFGGTTQKRNNTVKFASTSTSKQQQQQQLLLSKPASKPPSIVLPSRTKSVTIATTTGPPVEDIEFRAGRPYDPFEDDDDSVNISVDDEDFVPLENTPSFWMSMLSDEPRTQQKIHVPEKLMMNDDFSLTSTVSSCIDLSLEQGMFALGLVDDISFS